MTDAAKTNRMLRNGFIIVVPRATDIQLGDGFSLVRICGSRDASFPVRSDAIAQVDLGHLSPLFLKAPGRPMDLYVINSADVVMVLEKLGPKDFYDMPTGDQPCD